MPSAISNLIKQIDPLRKKVNSVKAKQVHSASLREEVRQMIEDYFKLIRPTIISDAANNKEVGIIDEQMQELLVLCHKTPTKTVYLKRVNDIRKQLVSLDSKLLSFVQAPPSSVNSVDTQIIETLTKILPTAALSYKQALIDLEGEDRFSWRGPATDLREALRETLDHLAPDKDVMAMPGFKLEKDTHGPTMKQKVRFILTKRGISKAQSATAESSVESVENIVGSFVRSVYTRSSISTHTATDKNEVLRIKSYVRVTLGELLEINV